MSCNYFQEIDEQVRLRLAKYLHYALRSRPSTRQQQYRCNLLAPYAHLNNAPKKLGVSVTAQVCDSQPIVSEHALSQDKQTGMITAAGVVAKTKSKRIVAKSSDCKLTPLTNPLGSCHNNIPLIVQKDTLPPLLQYVSSKYGTPTNQLMCFCSTGSFISNTVDSSGSGCGPNICCPREANICLPTPVHSESNLQTKFPIVHSIPSSAMTYAQYHAADHEKEIGSIEQGKDVGSVISTGKRSRSQLTFESRFEGGNLLNAIEV